MWTIETRINSWVAKLFFVSQTYMIKWGEKLSSGLVVAINNDQKGIKHHGNPIFHWQEMRLNLQMKENMKW